jgi:hypothetical protein
MVDRDAHIFMAQLAAKVLTHKIGKSPIPKLFFPGTMGFNLGLVDRWPWGYGFFPFLCLSP